jgi:hypothetical protein
MGPMGIPETSVSNYPTPHNNTGDERIQSLAVTQMLKKFSILYATLISTAVFTDIQHLFPPLSQTNAVCTFKHFLFFFFFLLAFTTHLRVLASSFLRFRDHTN